MSGALVGLVLLAALLHAAWNLVVKGGDDRLVTLALLMGSSAVVAAAALPLLPAVQPAAWPYLAASAVLHVGYLLLLLAAYRHGDFSQVYPLARGTGVLLTAAGAAAFVGERLDAVTLTAVALMAAGVTAMGLWGGRRGRFQGAALGFALATGVTIAVYTVVDGVGVRASGSVAAYAAWVFALNGAAFVAVAAAIRRRGLWASARARWREGLGGGAMAVVSYGIALYAMSLAPLAPVAALRETSVLFAAVLGVVVLKEPLGWVRAGAAVAIAAGVVLLRL